MGRHDIAARCLERLQADHGESQWTILLSDPHFAENARFGVHIEDSLYAATYDAFKADRYDEVKANTQLSANRFPLGANRPKFIFIDGLGRLNEGDATACVAAMKEVVEKYPDSEVTEMAGMIIKGVQAGRALHGGKFDIGDVWSRRGVVLESDSTSADTLSMERNTGFVFLLAYRADSLDANQLLYEMAKYNFSNFMVRNFDITIDQDQGISRMLISGFLNYDEALQYARRLFADEAMAARLSGCRRIIISEENLKMLGTRYSYVDYEEFFERSFAPLKITDEELLNIPESIGQPAEEPASDSPSAPSGNAPAAPQTDELDGLGLPPAPSGNVPVAPQTDELDGLGLPPAPSDNASVVPQTDELDGLGLPPAPSGNVPAAPQTDELDGLGLPPAPSGNAPAAPQTDDFDDLGLPPDIGGVNNNMNNEPPAGTFDLDEDFYR